MPITPPHVLQRRSMVLEFVRKRGPFQTTDLARALNIALETVRTDCRSLEKAGQLTSRKVDLGRGPKSVIWSAVKWG